jgi:uncharacterized protein YndB with AHSA1/START domain
MIPTLLATLIVTAQAGNLAPITASGIVNAPVKAVWDAYTTSDGINSWMVAKGRVDLRVGGKMVSVYDKNDSLDGPNAIENTYISFDPERMFSIRCTKTPAKFPFKSILARVWTVVYFRPVGAGKTELVCRMIGWDGSNESNKARAFFAKGNQFELDELAKHFKKA